MRRLFIGLIVAIPVLIAACGPRINCVGAGTRFAVFIPVYPIDGATAVPDSPGEVVFTGIVPDPTLRSVTIQLKPPTGTPVPIGPLMPAPSPLPTPNHSSPGGSYVSVSVPALSPATTYTVVVNGLQEVGNCNQWLQFTVTTTFTTQ